MDASIEFLLDSTGFERLEASLRLIVEQEIQIVNVAEEVINKLGELRRRSFLSRLIMLLEIYQLDISKLWPQGANLTEELDAMIKRRNKYIHGGKIDPENHDFDFYRIQGILELWILKLLRCPEDALNPYAYLSFLSSK